MEKLVEFELPTLSKRQQEIFNASLQTSPFDSIIAVTGRQCGKVQPNNTIVYDESGVKYLGDLKVGDYIQSGWDRLTKVTAIYEHQDWDFYKITFQDGSYTYAGLEHLWYGYNQKKKQVVWDTKTIMEKHNNFWIPETKEFNVTGSLLKVMSIEYSHKADGRCITVDDENHTYVCDNNIMTHNTFVAVQIMIYYLLEGIEAKGGPVLIGFFLPTYKQSKKVFKQIARGLEDVKDLFKFNYSDLTITYMYNNSAVEFWTADNENSRGNTFDILIVDEACFVKDSVYSAAIGPTIGVAKTKGWGKEILLSTPKTRNWFYKESITESDSKIVFRLTSEEGGQIGTKVLKELRKTTPEHIFANEYLGEFIESGNGLFKYADCILKGEPTDKVGVTAGLDFGVEDDYTVLTIMNKAGEVILVKRWNKVDWQDILDDVVKLLNQHGKPTVYCETNGIGNMPTKELGKKYNGTRTWNTSNKSKVDAINKLATDFHNKSIKIPNLEYLKNELDNFGTQTTKTGKLTYGASNGYHDDCVMSLAIANYHRHNGIRIQVNR